MADTEDRVSFELSGESTPRLLRRQLNQIKIDDNITYAKVTLESSTPFDTPDEGTLREKTAVEENGEEPEEPEEPEETEAPETFECEECGREFTSENVLEYHIEMEHEEEEEPEEPEVPEQDSPRVIQSPALDSINIEDIPTLDTTKNPYIVLGTLHQAIENISEGESVLDTLYQARQKPGSLPDEVWMSTPEVRENTESDKIEDAKFATVLYHLNERGLATRRPMDNGDYEYAITLDGELALQKAKENIEEAAPTA